MDWLEGTILEHEGIEGPATSMLPSLWEARIRAAHAAEVERVTAEYKARFTAPIVCLCGSTRFMGAWNDWRKRLTMQWKIVLSIELVTTQARHEDPQLVDLKTKDGLDALHKRKIDLCDEVMVLDVDGYIGESTRSEIDYAILTGKPVLYLSELYPDYVEPDDPVPAQFHNFEATNARLQARVERLEEAKNTAYSERQKMVQALTFIFPAHMKRHPDSDTEWENDWRNIVCVHGPAGQMTWHIHDSEAHMFGHLNRKPDHFAACEYDGHTTDEKYRRLLDSVLSRFCSGAADAAGEDNGAGDEEVKG